MKIFTRLRCTSLLLALSLAGLAQAATLPGTVYAGVQGGLTSFGNADETCNQISSGVASLGNQSVSVQTSCSIDSKSTGMGAFLGINLPQTAAAEIGYTDFGSMNLNFHATISSQSTYDVVHETGEGRAHAVHLSFVLHTDNAQGSNFMGRLGLYKATTDVSSTVSDIQGYVSPDTLSSSADNTGALFGFGVMAKFSGNLAGRLEFDRFQNIGDENKTFKSDLNMLSLGLALTFR